MNFVIAKRRVVLVREKRILCFVIIRVIISKQVGFCIKKVGGGKGVNFLKSSG